jgi:hypothetical protein
MDRLRLETCRLGHALRRAAGWGRTAKDELVS